MTIETNNRSLLASLSQLARGLSSTFDAHLRTAGLTAARGRVLLFLAQNDRPVGQSEVTAYLRVESPTVVRILDGLETLGYVRRLPDPSDRRAKLVELTASGRPRAAEVVALTLRLELEIMSGISTAETEAARRVLGKIIRNIAAASATVAPLDADDMVPA